MLATWGAWFVGLWPRWFVVNEAGIWSGQPFIWADWSVHLTYLSHFRYTPWYQWFSHHPVFSLEHSTYPPLPNLLSSGLTWLGVPLGPAMLIPVIIATAALLWLLYEWFLRQHLSERASFTGVTLFLLSGSWGWLTWLQAVQRNGISEIQFPSRLYTQILEQHLVWLNPIAGMVLPQRSFLLGFPILLWLLIKLRQICLGSASTRLEPVRLAFITAILFLTHTHSFLALGLLCAFWFLVFPNRWRFWIRYGLATALFIFPWYWLVLRGSGAIDAFAIDLGWMSREPFSLVNWLVFWLKNWGFTLPLALLGWWHSSRRERLWSAAFFGLFLFANIVRTQNYDWDNGKLLIVSLVGLLPLMLRELRTWLHWSAPRLGALSLVVVVLLSIWSGSLEAIRVSQPQRTFWIMAGPREIEFARRVREIVPPNEIVLTSDSHNHPVPMLAGRPVLLGYIGWVWSYGFDYGQVEADVKTMFTDTARSRFLRRQYGIRYVAVGPSEREKFDGTIFPQRECQEKVRVESYTLLECD